MVPKQEFQEVACIIDGTEIRVSRPTKEPWKTKLYSGKKKQHSLNVLIIVLLNGQIIFYDGSETVSDQQHWNQTNVRERFIGKNFGIMGDGGFTFNKKKESTPIHGYKPFKKKAGQQLTEEQRQFNHRLSSMRVLVENVIARLKKFKIFKGVFRHYKAGRSQIPFSQILTVVVGLTNRRLRQSPLREQPLDITN